MPKQKKTHTQMYAKICRRHPGIFQCAENDEVFCRLCNCVVQARKLFSVEQHCRTNKHRMLVTTSEPMYDAPNVMGYDFEVSKCFLEANIPLSKMEHPSISALLEKYTEQTQPNLATLQLRVPKLYKDTIKTLQNLAKNEYIWTSMDFVTDAEGRLIANFIFGILNPDGVGRENRYLLNATLVNESDEAAYLSMFFVESLILLWPQGIQYDKVLVCVTGADTNMIQVMSILKKKFPKMLHINCFAQSFHRLGEYVRKCFPDVNCLISNTNTAFLMSPYNRYLFKKHCPKLPNLPPNPCITRWCTWLKAAFFYSEYFAEVKNVVLQFNDDDAEAIIEAKRLFNDQDEERKIQNDLNLLKQNFAMLVKGTERIEQKGLNLQEVMTVVENVFDSIASTEKKEYLEKLLTHFYKTDGYTSLMAIHKALYENSDIREHPYIKELTNNELELFKFCPVNVYQAERTFPLYSQIFNSQLRMLRFEALKQNLIIYSNNFKDD